MRAKSRRLHHQLNDALVVDYLQLMRHEGRVENRVEQVGRLGLARELNAPVIALSQLSRAVEQTRWREAPRSSD